jgi:O-Antigen ligase
VINADYPLFSSYRWVAHAMIVVPALVFLPRIVRMTDISKLLLALKVIVAVILIVSYFWPAKLNVLDVAYQYRGIFGNANALGHMSAVGCLLFMHGFITQRGSRWGQIQAVMAALAALLLIQSGARGSLVAFLGGFLVFYWFYKSHLTRYAVLGIIGVAVVLVVSPDIPKDIESFIIKHESAANQVSSMLEKVTISRQALLEDYWEGFTERPLLGWGFGLDKNSNLSNWSGEWSSVSVIGRDPVNDIVYTLESGGIVGLFVYVYILALILKVRIPRTLRLKLDATLRQRGYELPASAYDAQTAFYCLTILLIVLFEFDNTALAAGNFFSALLWVSLGLSLGLYALLMHSLRLSATIPNSLTRPAAALQVK